MALIVIFIIALPYTLLQGIGSFQA
ncbi:hypothetical protein J2Z66_007702 [Paenibacillus eucommiae]|uniref:Uncharacterized protein n=1 Tax=Paenibacillus eucommiae TaxID=1355755 RepID=A0ABS4J8B0_9BACL|nr:hypothetical protein [Paenibacillus eucommiae]